MLLNKLNCLSSITCLSNHFIPSFTEHLDEIHANESFIFCHDNAYTGMCLYGITLI